MRALVWINEDTWEVTAAEAAEFLPGDADITLLHVTSTEPETVGRAARRGLLGRHPPPPATSETWRDVSEQAATELLADAQARLGRPATSRALRGRIERERLGPRSLGPATRFVIDHAPCRVLLIWPDTAPELTTIPPPPPGAPLPHHPPHR